MNNDKHEIQEQQILDFLRPRCEIKASDNLRKRVAHTLNPQKRSKHLKWAVGCITSVAAAVAVIILTASPRVSAKDVIRDALAFIEDSFTVKFEARTLPSENFAYFDKDLPFTPVTLSVSGNDWMVDKGGRKAMGNDSIRYMWLPAYNTGWMTRNPKPNFIEDFNRLLDPRQLLSSYLALPDGNMVMRTTDDRIVISTDKYGLTYCYAFDKKSHRLMSYTISDGDVVLLRTTGISYESSKHPLASVPDNINWIDVSEMKDSFMGLSAEEAVQVALAALQDWKADIVTQGFDHAYYDVDRFKETYSGAVLLGVGSSRQGATPYKFFVPYRIRLKDGTIQDGNLSLEHQTDGSWIIDGGI